MNKLLLEHIAHFADHDTRRAMGFTPRKLDPSWKEFRPRCFSSELYRYFVSEKRLEYMEVSQFGFMYIDIVTDVEPGIDGSWVTGPNSVNRGVYHKYNYTDEYCVKNGDRVFHTAGIPDFVLK